MKLVSIPDSSRRLVDKWESSGLETINYIHIVNISYILSLPIIVFLPEADLSTVFWGVRWSIGTLNFSLKISKNNPVKCQSTNL